MTAVDAEPSMAEAAARKVPGLDVRVAVLPDLPLPAAEFDAVTGNFNRQGDRNQQMVTGAGQQDPLGTTSQRQPEPPIGCQ